MRRHLVCLLTIAMVLGSVTAAHAYPFPATDVRGLSMGGAYVAGGSGAASVMYNPALVKKGKSVEISLPNVNVRVDDHIGLRDTIDVINQAIANADSTALIQALDSLVDGAGIDGQVYAGGTVSFSALGLGLAAGYSDLIYGSSFPTNIDTSISGLIDPTKNQLAYGGLEARQVVLTAAGDLGGVLLGANVRFVDGTTYLNAESLLNSPNLDLDTLLDGISQSSNQTALDVGILFNLAPMIDIGVVGINVNEPKFPFVSNPIGLDNFVLDSQYRAGMAINLKVLQLTADVDLNEVDSFGSTPYQEWAVGAELKLGPVALRGGLSENFAFNEDPMVYSAGLGLNVPFFRWDIGARYGGDGDFLGAGTNFTFKF